MSEKLKNIEAKLSALTANHTPELSTVYMNASGTKLRNGEKSTNDVIFFNDTTAEAIYKFMRKTIGENPLVIN